MSTTASPPPCRSSARRDPARARDRVKVAPEAVARAIGQPADVGVGEIVVRPTAQA